MKKINVIALLLISTVFLLSSCANKKTFTIDGERVTVEPYGPADEEALKNDKVVYQVCVGNVVCDILFCETVVIPVWLIGWDLYEPVRLKTKTELEKSCPK